MMAESLDCLVENRKIMGLECFFLLFMRIELDSNE